MPKSICNEIQITICTALKKLVLNFVNLPIYNWSQDIPNRGNWIYVIPFIHFWDLSEEQFLKWCNLDNWNRNLQVM